MIITENVEQRLLKRLQDGDKSAAREFYTLYADYLAGICSRYIDDEDDLKDVFQDAFIHILNVLFNRFLIKYTHVVSFFCI